MTVRLFCIFTVLAVVACGDDDGSTDSAVPDTSILDTAMPDTTMADTDVADTSADTSVADASVDTGTDAPTTGSVSGTVTATVACAAAATVDCVGDVYVVLFDADIPWTSTVVASVVVSDANLADGAGVAFTIEDVPPGSWFLGAFQDDDDNAAADMPTPSPNDPTLVGTHPVSVSAGMPTIQDAVLNQRVVG